MRNFNPQFQVNPAPQQDNLEAKNLSSDAKKLLEILDELQDFTTSLRKKLLSDLKADGHDENSSQS